MALELKGIAEENRKDQQHLIDFLAIRTLLEDSSYGLSSNTYVGR